MIVHRAEQISELAEAAQNGNRVARKGSRFRYSAMRARLSAKGSAGLSAAATATPTEDDDSMFSDDAFSFS